MRISNKQREIITETIRNLDPDASIRLFGSRALDSGQGGDIDLLVLSDAISYRQKLWLRSVLKEKLGNRKIDLIITGKPNSAFVKYAFANSVIV